MDIEDRILDERRENYCSSSSSDDERPNCTEATDEDCIRSPLCSARDPRKASTNTGPKGVIADFERFEQEKLQKKSDGERKALEAAKRLTLQGSSSSNRQSAEGSLDESDDEYLNEYRHKRLDELRRQFSMRLNPDPMVYAFRQYGTVENLEDGDAFLRVTDEMSKETTVFVHIYATDVKACRILNQCLDELAADYPTTKFCRISAQKLPTSVNFRIAALPCFQVYHLGQLVDNWVCLTEHIGLDFSVEQVKDFLQSHGYLLE